MHHRNLITFTFKLSQIWDEHIFTAFILLYQEKTFKMVISRLAQFQESGLPKNKRIQFFLIYNFMSLHASIY